MIKGGVSGQAELRHVQTILTVEAPAQLRKDLTTGTREGLAPLKKDIQEEAMARLPKRGGYATLLARAVKVSTRVIGGAKVKALVRVSATGKREERDIWRLNKGELRHPVFGRYRMTKKGPKANPWAANRIRRGLVDDPVDRARDRVVDNARNAARKYADEIRRG